MNNKKKLKKYKDRKDTYITILFLNVLCETNFFCDLSIPLYPYLYLSFGQTRINLTLCCIIYIFLILPGVRLENIIMAIEHMSGGQWCSGQRSG